MLKKDGKIVIEVQYFIETLKNYSFDNIYHEHFNYWTLTALNNFFLNHKCRIFKAEKINTHGGSLRIYATKNFKKKIEASVKNIMAQEKLFGLFSLKKYFKFKNKINNIKDNFSKNIVWLKKKYPNLVGYGASAKSTVAINFFKLEEGYLNYMIDDNASKQNHFIPGTKIKILKNNKLVKRKIDCILVFAWNNFEEIKFIN